ncbi:MAG: alpha/beta fold hydrolase [Proteobacteria bacterium]|nr:alpha/beta fold hydrolase [Pseudomonadota bacterium]
MERAFSVSEKLYPFESHWCEVDRIPVHYIDEGSGPTLLFLHGNPTWSFLYRDIVAALRGDYRCVAIDYPGMGLSGKPRDFGRSDYKFTPAEHSAVVERIVEALDLRDITLMVQDWGGPIGLGFATRQPERIRRLVIGNTWAWPADHLDMKVFSTVLGRGPGRLLVMRRNAFVKWLLPSGINRKERLTPDVLAAYEGPYPTPKDREPTAVFPRAIVASRHYLAEVESGLHRLADKPVKLVWGNRDRAFRKRELERWRALFPQASLEMLDGANHFIQEDAPEQISAAIRTFAAST